MKKTIILTLALILLLPVVFSSIERLGTFKINDPIELVQICANCTFVNISSITAPNSSIILTDVEMTKSGVRFNYTLTPQQSLGDYQVCGHGDLDGENTVWCFSFDITTAGFKPTTAQGLIYVISLLMAIGTFTLMIFIGFNVDTKKFERDTITGKVIAVNWKKYWRVFCWGMAYAIAIWITHLIRSVAEIFLESIFISKFFEMLFKILLNLSWPLMALLFYLLVASWVMDIKNKRLINRGLTLKK